MKLLEFGQENEHVLLFLHGGGLAQWNFLREAKLLEQRYHIVIPVLNGHAGSDKDFTTIEEQAEDLIRLIAQRFGGTVYAICGLSLGAQVLVEMLSQKHNVCRYALIESALVRPMKLTHALTPMAVAMSYPLMAKPWFAKLQFQYLNIGKELFSDYYRDSCRITQENMTAFLKANTGYTIKPALRSTTAKALILVGEKEQGAMKTSADLLHKTIPDSRMKLLPGYTHGELSLNHPAEYADMLMELFSQ